MSNKYQTKDLNSIMDHHVRFPIQKNQIPFSKLVNSKAQVQVLSPKSNSKFKVQSLKFYVRGKGLGLGLTL